MKSIKHIVKDIREELDGAEHYAEIAAKLRDTDMTAANTYAEMARQELSHVDKLHGLAVKLINEQKTAGVTVPAAMQAVWDWEHEGMVERSTRIKMLLDMSYELTAVKIKRRHKEE